MSRVPQRALAVAAAALLLLSLDLPMTPTAAARSPAAAPTIGLAPAVLQPGEGFRVTGSGFSPGRRIELRLDATRLAVATADASGRLPRTTMMVPLGTLPGMHAVTARDIRTDAQAAARLAVHTDWPQWRYDAAHTGPNPLDRTFTPANVDRLAVAWYARLASGGGQSVAVWRGTVVATGSGGKYAGRVWAFDADCTSGGGRCRPLWFADTGGPIPGAPAMGKGLAFVGSSDGKVYAFKARCRTDGGRCSPVWTGVTDGSIGTSPTLSDGVVYVGVDGSPPDQSGVVAFGARCATGGGSCGPLWVGHTSHWVSASAPAVAAGSVHIGARNGPLVSFPVGCRDDGGVCRSRWVGGTGDAIMQSSPAVVGGTVYVATYGWWNNGRLWAFPSACEGTECPPRWKAPLAGYGFTSPAVTEGRVYVGNQNDGVYVFKARCGSRAADCTPVWIGDGDSLTSVSLAGGLVFAAAWYRQLVAWPVDCATGGGRCDPVMERRYSGNLWSNPASPVIADGAVFLVNPNDGNLYAWKLDAGVPARRTR